MFRLLTQQTWAGTIDPANGEEIFTPLEAILEVQPSLFILAGTPRCVRMI